MSADTRDAAPVLVRAISDEEVARFHADGWVHLPNLVGEATVAELLRRFQERRATDPQAFQSITVKTPNATGADVSGLFDRWENPSAQDAWIRSFSRSPALAAVASRLLRDRPVRWW